MRQVIRRNIYEIRYDTAFEQVITHCQQVKRKDQDGTWITDQLLSAYIELHKSGWAHSVEAWKDGELAGGLYGLSIGKVFFGESMFSLQPNASKVAFHSLVYQLDKRGFLCIDCQWHNSHLESLGAEMIPREAFLAILEENNKLKSLTGSWTHFTK
jgi:leucyl/phenylalanyl-tRNA--protein transferase